MSPLDGVLVIDKPDGLTSHDAVASIRRLLPRHTKVGHTGTLDPFATGVLPIVIGKATRLARFLSGEDKRYAATVTFGRSTTTYDRTGETVDETPSRGESLTYERVAQALASFTGRRAQAPPAYSAKKVDGVRAYERARRGDVTPPVAVVVTAHALTLLALDQVTGHASLEVHCSAGFYVRSLAHDLGVAVGVPAHLHALRRTGAGHFAERHATPLGDLLAGGLDAVHRLLRPMAAVLPQLPVLSLTDAQCRLVAHGQPIPAATLLPAATRAVPPPTVPAGAPDEDRVSRVCLLDPQGHLIALALCQVGPPALVHADIVLL